MLTKRQYKRRETKQIRISLDVHRKIKFESVKKSTTISKLADRIISRYFNTDGQTNLGNKEIVSDHNEPCKVFQRIVE